MTILKKIITLGLFLMLPLGISATTCMCSFSIGTTDYNIAYQSSGSCSNPDQIDYSSGIAVVVVRSPKGTAVILADGADPGLCLSAQ